MANLSAAFSPKEFELAIAHEATVGTASSTVGDYILINIDSIEMPSLNPQQVLDIRHGAGRTLKEVDISKVVELFDNTDLTGELACAGGACEFTESTGIAAG